MDTHKNVCLKLSECVYCVNLNNFAKVLTYFINFLSLQTLVVTMKHKTSTVVIFKETKQFRCYFECKLRKLND